MVTAASGSGPGMVTSSPAARPLVDAFHDGRITRRELVSGAFKLGFSVAGAAALLSACHSSSHPAAPARLSGRVQILIGFDGGNTAPQRQVQQALAQAFIAQHPQVGIDLLRATSAAAASSQLTTLIARGSAPDIVLGIDLADLSSLVDQHVWLDLHPLFKRDGISTHGFQSQALAAAKLSGYYGGSDAIPGVPLGVHDHALAYNVDLFAKEGVPAPPASWSDDSWTLTGSFLQAAQALTLDSSGKRVGQPGFDSNKVTQFGLARVQPEQAFFSFGGRLYDDSRRLAQFDTADAISGAQFAGDLIHRYQVQPTAAQLAQLSGAPATEDQAQVAWRAGKLAMIDMCSCEISSPYGSQVPFPWKAAAFPAGPAERYCHLEVSVGAIVAASAHQDLAWEFLKFVAVDPAQERQMAYGGFGAMPAVTTNLAAFAQGTQQATGVDAAVWQAGLPGASAEYDAWIPAFTSVQDLTTNAFNLILGGARAATVMPQLQTQAQSQITAWFKSHTLPH